MFGLERKQKVSMNSYKPCFDVRTDFELEVGEKLSHLISKIGIIDVSVHLRYQNSIRPLSNHHHPTSISKRHFKVTHIQFYDETIKCLLHFHESKHKSNNTLSTITNTSIDSHFVSTKKSRKKASRSPLQIQSIQNQRLCA